MILLAGCSSSAERAAVARDEGEALVASGDRIAARERFDTAVSLRDDQPELWVARARNQVALGDYGGAFASYSSALDLDRTNREALDAVGQIALLAGKTDEAGRIADQILTLAPDDPTALYVRGAVELQNGRLEAATATIEQGLRVSPEDENLLMLRGRLLTRRGDLSGAERVLRPLLDQQTQNPLVFDQLAVVYRRMFAGRDLLRVLAAATRARPNDPRVLHDFGKQLLATGLIGDGLRMVELAIARDKESDNDWSVLRALAESNVAPEALKLALAEQPKLAATTRVEVARYALVLEQPGIARAVLLQLPTDRRDDDWSAMVAYLLAQAGRSAEADRLVVPLLQADPQSTFALAARALTAALAGKPDDALRDARLLSSNAPEDVEATEVLAKVLTRQGDPVAARAAYLASFNANRDNVLFLRALVLSRRFGDGVADLRPSVRDFTVRNPEIVGGWALRRSLCTALRDSACAARASAIMTNLSGGRAAIPPAPPEERQERVGA